MRISNADVKEALTGRLGRTPTKEELERFVDYLEVDISQWLDDNAKCFVRDVLGDGTVYVECPNCHQLTSENPCVKCGKPIRPEPNREQTRR